MIKQVKVIKNIGNFHSFTDQNEMGLSPLTLIYAENGRGKTTLCSIFRSLAENDPFYIKERERLGSKSQAKVVLFIDDNGAQSKAVFENSTWSGDRPKIYIFDDLFVHENVYSGLIVESDHRKNLHEIIIGRTGVSIARAVAKLTNDIAVLHDKMKSKSTLISNVTKSNLTVDEFCSLSENPDINNAIDKANRLVDAKKKEKVINSTPSFEKFSMPEINIESLKKLLLHSINDLDVDTLKSVQAHFLSLGDSAEEWVSRGVKYISMESTPGTCPFCGINIEASSLVDHYRAYFGKAYKDHKRLISDNRSEFKKKLTGDEYANFHEKIINTHQNHKFWTKFIKDLPGSSLNDKKIKFVWNEARDVLNKLLKFKASAPLERIEIDDEDLIKLHTYQKTFQQVCTQSENLQKYNGKITEIKAETKAKDLDSVQEDLNRLLDKKERYSEKSKKLCSEYLKLKSQKKQLEKAKKIAKEKLEKHRKKVIPQYESGVNEFLRKFNANFRIVEIEAKNPKGKPSSNYCIELNGHQIPVSGSKPMPGNPSFRNTLSSGDRNTLALAFFFANLKLEPNIGSAIVVIDDPVSSLDDSRCMATAQEIRSISVTTRQTIVLSHSKQLLCSIWDHADQKRCSEWQVQRCQTGSTIIPWVIHNTTITEYDRRHALLRSYAQGNEVKAREVAESLRPVLEGFLRVAANEYFRPGTLIGIFINNIRDKRKKTSPILPSIDIGELEKIKEYANRFHHNSNPEWAKAINDINEEELRGYVNRVLNFTLYS